MKHLGFDFILIQLLLKVFKVCHSKSEQLLKRFHKTYWMIQIAPGDKLKPYFI